ncbi:ElaA protein [Rhodobacter aestuarii]|uniref:ElaA protein n=1 Tax=Rhodobacter aestuarii TaxID=453582 RepID=A0A1N7N482_9RHOB|nr:GNAT family N-acetyltransferase [Rhodobacter aestuarii]PTV96224.1 ElaA protein [Rhodobacter aestuarii]SIS93140.1 ElaA protein [Rhodobacter aestuarii]
MKIIETSDLTAPHALRRQVFIEEQGIAEAEEWDDLDGEAIHLLALEGDAPMGTARLFVKGDLGKIGRVCVAMPARGTGLGKLLILEGCERLRAAGCTRVQLGAQVQAMGFYEKLGFVAFGPVYDDAGIPHRDMERVLA